MTPPVLDEYLPRFDVVERHKRQIHQPIDRVWEALLATDFSRSRLVRWLFALRGMSAAGSPEPLTLEALQQWRFAVLETTPPQRIVLGIVGRFWTPGGQLQKIDREIFSAGPPVGSASAAWSFELEPIDSARTTVATETRVLAGDEASRRAFRRYWRLVGPFSALIRKRMLRLLEAEANV